MNVSALDLQVHVIDGNESLELFTQSTRFKNEFS